MAQPTDVVTRYAAYGGVYYATAAIPSVANVVGQFATAGSGYNQVNVLYVNTGPTLDAGTVYSPVTEATAVKSNI